MGGSANIPMVKGFYLDDTFRALLDWTRGIYGLWFLRICTYLLFDLSRNLRGKYRLMMASYIP